MTTLMKSKHLNHLCGVLLSAVSTTLSAAQDPVFTEITDSPISESYAFSAAWGDYDKDGFLDLLMLWPWPAEGWYGHTQIYLFKNQGDGSFAKDVLDPIAFPHTGQLNGAIWGDYDNDGRLDILINGGGVWLGANSSILLHQEPDRSFSRSSSPVFPSGVTQSGLWADFDGDGWLDIFAGYWTGNDTPSVTDILYRNNGDGSFSNSYAPGIDHLNSNLASALSAATGDFNGDGLLDILVTTLSPDRTRLYLNNGDGSFARLMATPGAWKPWVGDPNAAHGLAVADYDNDGDLDFVTVSRSGEFSWTCACEGPFKGRTILYRNNGAGEFEAVTAGDLGTAESIGANDGAWADYNNDGWLDLVLFRGLRSDGQGHNATDLLYRNNGDGTFTRVWTGPIVNDDGDARAGAWADYDNDGDMDLVVANYKWSSPGGSDRLPVLYRNEGNENHWLTLRLTGTEANRDAIGAKVRVKAVIGGRELWQLREIRSKTGWIGSQDDMRPHFGLGDATVAEVVRIEWPSGTVQEMTHVTADQILTVTEPPRLRLEDGNSLSWPAAAEGFEMQTASSVSGPWNVAEETPETQGNRVSVLLEGTDGVKFYRLHQP